MKKVHLIATGGSVMHNIALALHGMGYQVSGSDDQIYEPARSRLSEAGILPQKEGWYPDRISRDLDAVILGMHAKSDNPELGRARELGVPIYSFPEFVGLQYQHKRQIVVIGSHGKTTTTSMLMHVFKSLGLSFDYLVGAQLEGFQNMVSFSDAPLAIIEGDEYLSSCLDAQPKFMHYHPFVTIVTGVAWDHYNVFPTYVSYLKAFTDRIESLEIGHHIVYYQEDAALCDIIDHHGSHLVQHPYDTALHESNGHQSSLVWDHQQFPLHIFGKHNLQNIQAVLETCSIFGLNMKEVFESLTRFKGASKRMELVSDNGRQKVYRDFAHAPSKVKATLQAIRDRYPSKSIGVILELHTYSSLNPDFLPQYKDSCQPVDQLVVYFDQKALEIKRMAPLDADLIQSAFNRRDAIICPDLIQLQDAVSGLRNRNDVLLFLGSGQFGGLELAVAAD